MRFIIGDPSDIDRFLEEREALRASHARVWRKRNREGGLQESCDYFDTIRPGL